MVIYLHFWKVEFYLVYFIFDRKYSSEKLKKALIENVTSKKETAILMVPEQSSFACEREMLKKMGNKNFAKIKILSFSRIYDFVSQIIKIPPIKPISDTKKILLMNAAIENVKDKLNLYNKNSSDINTIELILSTIMDFKSEKISDEDLEKIINSTKKSYLKQKISDIKLIKSEYQNLTENKFVDLFDSLNILENIIKENNVFKDYTIYIDEFVNFTKQQLEILKIIISQAKNVYFSFKFPSAEDDIMDELFYSVKKSVNQIKKIASENSISTCNINDMDNFNPCKINSELEILEKNIFNSEKISSQNCPQNIKLYRAMSTDEEIEFVAASIKKMVMNYGYKYSDFAVIMRSADSYAGLFKSKFKKYEIPFFLDTPQKILQNNLINLIFSAIDSIKSNYSIEDVMRYLKSGLTDLSTEEISLIENYILLWEIKGKTWMKPFSMHPEGFKSGLSEKDEQILIKLNELRVKIIEPLEKLKGSVKKSCGKEISKAIYNFLTDIHASENLKKFCLKNINENNLKIAQDCARIWDILMEILNETGIIFSNKIIPISKYRDILFCAINCVDFSSIPQNSDHVLVGVVERTYISRPKILFAIGAANGEFPKAPSQSNLFTNAEISGINELGIEIGSANEDFLKKEKFLAYDILTSPTEKLFITWSSSGPENSTLLPSEIIKEVKEIFPAIKIPDKYYFTEEEMIWCESFAFSTYAAKYKDKSLLSQTLKYYFENNENYSSKCDIIKKICDDSPIKLKNPENIKKITQSTSTLSASQIEKYYTCRFGYFCKYILKAKNNLPAKFNAIEYGNIVHFVLEKLFKKYPQQSIISKTSIQISNEINLLVNDFVNNNLGGFKNKNQRFVYIIEKIKKSILYLVEHFKKEFQETLFKLSDLELEISEKGEISPFELQNSDGTSTKIEGKIDRVDIFNSTEGTYVRIIDYKTGSKEFKLSDVLFGLNMQMLIYLMSIQKNGGEKYGKVLPAGVLYFPALKPIGEAKTLKEAEEISKNLDEKLKMNGLILNNIKVISAMEKDGEGIFIPAKISGESIKSNSLTDFNKLEIIYKYIEKKIKNMIEELKNGNIFESPIKSTDTACKWCEFFPICCYEKNDFMEIKKMSNEKSIEEMEKV